MSPGDMNVSVSLPEELANFVRTEQREAEKLTLLRQGWRKGSESGGAGEIDFAALKQEARARLAALKRGAQPSPI